MPDLAGGRRRRWRGRWPRPAAAPGASALVVPDSIARVSLVRFETVPARGADLDELIRWQVKKTTPFPLDEAVVAATPGRAPAAGAHEFVVSVARRDVVAQYEAACAARRLRRPGSSTWRPSTSSTRCWPAAGAARGDWLLVHAADTYVSLAVIRDGHLIFYRTRGEESEGSIADLVHQTAMYYEDRLSGQRFDGVLLAGGATAAGADHLRRELSDRLGHDVASVDPFQAASPTSGRPVVRRWPTCWRRRSACWCAKGRRPSRAARQPGHPAVLQRAAGPRAARHRAGRGGGVDGGQRRQPGQPVAAGRDAGRARAQRRAGRRRRRGGRRRRCAPRSTRPRSPRRPARPPRPTS